MKKKSNLVDDFLYKLKNSLKKKPVEYMNHQ